MHLEDRLQELYFKSKMLSEYLKGQMRVHVKELGVVLGYGHTLLRALHFLTPNPPPALVLSTAKWIPRWDWSCSVAQITRGLRLLLGHCLIPRIPRPFSLPRGQEDGLSAPELVRLLP